MTTHSASGHIRIIQALLVFGSLHVAVSLLWIAFPWGNKFPHNIYIPEYAIVFISAFLASARLPHRVILPGGIAIALSSYLLGLVLLLAILKVVWPNTVMGCIEDGWEWYCPGPLPVVTEGWPALRIVAEKVIYGGVFAFAGCGLVYFARKRPNV